MQRALELAQKGLGFVSPNPLVGCVIVEQDEIIGEGWHQKYGENHAEVNAIASVVDKERLKTATLYVTLEPCAHFGKTPPCADLIVECNIPKVVICNKDPFPKVDGRGIDKLINAGIEVESDVLSAQGEWINRRFFTSITKERPYIILKWAQTKDGFVARKNFDSKWISNSSSRKLVHKWRAEEDSILVGYNTALHDNPKLNCRDWEGTDPVRIFIDREGSLPATHSLCDGTIDTIGFTKSKNESSEESKFERKQVDFKNLEEQILGELHHRNIRSLIIEGGSNTLNRFIEKGMWDEARVFTGDARFEEGIKAPSLDINSEEQMQIENDLLEIFVNK